VKNSRKCPKCQSADIVRIPNDVASGYKNRIMVGVLKTVTPVRYVCGACGFAEEWLDSPADIERIKAYYQNSPRGARGLLARLAAQQKGGDHLG
jgi:ribosomal protein S27AE